MNINKMKRFFSQKTLEGFPEGLEAALGETTPRKPLFNDSILLKVTKTPQLPQAINFQRSIQPAFIVLDNTAALRMALHNSRSWRGRYEQLTELPQLSRDSKDSLDHVLNTTVQRREWAPVDTIDEIFDVKFPEGTQTALVELINESTSPLDVIIEDLIANKDQFVKYSFEDVTYLLVKLFQEIEDKPQFLSQLAEIFDTKILHFHDRILISIQQSLLASHNAQVLPLVNTINSAYNTNTQVNDTNGPFFQRFPLSLINDYLITSIHGRDLKTAKPLLDWLISQGVLPQEKVIHQYINLSSRLCSKLPIEREKQVMLFNNLTVNLQSVVIEQGMLTNGVIESICKFIDLNQIDLFINYLKLNADFPQFKQHTLQVIIKKLLDTSGDKSMVLTSVLTKLGVTPTDDDLTPRTRNMIIHILRKFHQPLACKVWEV